MKTRERIFNSIEAVWENSALVFILVVAAWTLFQICWMWIGNIAIHLAVFNDGWKQETASHCVQHIAGCQRVDFAHRYWTTAHGGPKWQWIGARLDMQVVAKPGTAGVVEQELVQHIGRWSADHLSLQITDAKGQK